MRKTILLLCILYTNVVVFGQFRVLSNGNVQTNGIVSLGNNQSNVSAFLRIDATNNSTSGTRYGVYSRFFQGGGAPTPEIIGVYGEVQNNSSTYPARHIGVRGHASTIANDRVAIGVAGTVGTSGNHIAIAGASFGASSLPTSLPSSLFAGYFIGNVHVVGNSTWTSDERFKRNITSLNNEKTLDRLMSLRPKEYNLERVEVERDSINEKGERVTFNVKLYSEKSQEFQKMHYGLLAQDLQKVYPDLVYDGGDDFLAINYIGLIPILISSIQELNERVVALERALNSNVRPNNAPSNVPNVAPQQEPVNENEATLFQNVPNPFNERTEIAFYLPQSVKNATLFVYDMNGRQLSQHVIAERGHSSLVINGSRYNAGMYLYSLIVDGRLIDTKRMVLTE